MSDVKAPSHSSDIVGRALVVEPQAKGSPSSESEKFRSRHLLPSISITNLQSKRLPRVLMDLCDALNLDVLSTYSWLLWLLKYKQKTSNSARAKIPPAIFFCCNATF